MLLRCFIAIVFRVTAFYADWFKYEKVTTNQSLGIIYTFIRSYIIDAPIATDMWIR